MKYIEFAQGYKQFNPGDRRYVRDTDRAQELIDVGVAVAVESPSSAIGSGPQPYRTPRPRGPKDSNEIVDL